MSRGLNEEVVGLLKALIHQISGYQDGTKPFSALEKQATSQLRKADTMSFVNQKDIDMAVSNMSQKFMFHGFLTHASQLERAYRKYITQDVSKAEVTNKLNVIKFLLSLSESPTNHFWKNPEEFIHKEEEPEEVINWGEFLNEGIKIWYPESGDESSLWSDDSDMSIGDLESDDVVDANEYRPPVIVDNTSNEVIIDFRANREELFNTIQHTWYNNDQFIMHPPSDWDDANIGIIWEDYLKDQVKGLISIESSSIISEYKVIREVLWQLFHPHTSTVFQLKENAIQPKPNITISSVRQMPFMSFLSEFIPYIELLDYFRSFEASLWTEGESAKPETYRSYFRSINSILVPVYSKIVQIEDKAREQETTMTLLMLASELKELFEPLQVLRLIHESVTENFSHQSRLKSATDLLYKLHQSLKYSYGKLEHDIKLTLYLESLYFYFKIIDSWLMKNDFNDFTDEFVIQMAENNSESWKINFVVKDDIDPHCKNDRILRIFIEDVLEIGRNLGLLRQLGKYNPTSESLVLDDSQMETMHDDFVDRILKEVCKYYEDTDSDNSHMNKVDGDSLLSSGDKKFKSPVICTDICKKVTDMDKLENTVDTCDGFLMEAFKVYFVKLPEPNTEAKEDTLFEKISKVTKSLFPTQNFLEKAFVDILKERFTISGLMVKNLLIEEYKLDKQFEFLRHVFLFADDLIFPFYRRFFGKVNSSNRNWGNKIWLTSHLQDIIMDIYPNFYEKCTIEIKDYWKHCMDFLSSLQLVNIQYKIEWPLNIIITPDQMELYQEVFQLLFKLKWSLYTVNHLVFKVIEPVSSRKNQNRLYKTTVMRLKYLRFSLLNILNSIQHYIFGFIYNTCLKRFELDFEKSSDLKTLMAAHSDFIVSLHKAVVDALGSDNSETGFSSILRSVKVLNNIWNNIAIASSEKLTDCYAYYKAGFKVLEPIVNPIYIFDY